MGIWRTALKSGVDKWRGRATVINKADDIIKALTDINPKHFHPKVYRAVCEEARQQYDHYFLQDAPLTDEEVAMVMLIAFCGIMEGTGQIDKHEMFGTAIRTLRKNSPAKIRAAISLSATGETGF